MMEVDGKLVNRASMWGFSLENGGVSKSGVRIVYGRCTVSVHVGLCRLVCRSRG